jgi:hypothetical protein
LKEYLIVCNNKDNYTALGYIEAFRGLSGVNLNILELKYDYALLERILFKLIGFRFFVFTKKIENKLFDKLSQKNYDVIFLIKELHLKSNAYNKIKNMYPDITISGMTYDYLGNNHTSSRNLIYSLKYYNIYFAPQKHYIDYIKEKKCNRVRAVPFSVPNRLYDYAENLYKQKLDILYDVLVVANFEEDRARQIEFLLENGIKVKLVGNNWWKAVKYKNIYSIKSTIRPMQIEDVVKATIQSRVTLAFLRKKEFDRVTARTFEIPAFYGFMLHEHNEVVRSAFLRCGFVDFFKSKDELLEKVVNVISNYNEIKYNSLRLEAHKYIKNKGYLLNDNVKMIDKEINLFKEKNES